MIALGGNDPGLGFQIFSLTVDHSYHKTMPITVCTHVTRDAHQVSVFFLIELVLRAFCHLLITEELKTFFYDPYAQALISLHSRHHTTRTTVLAE